MKKHPHITKQSWGCVDPKYFSSRWLIFFNQMIRFLLPDDAHVSNRCLISMIHFHQACQSFFESDDLLIIIFLQVTHVFLEGLPRHNIIFFIVRDEVSQKVRPNKIEKWYRVFGSCPIVVASLIKIPRLKLLMHEGTPSLKDFVGDPCSEQDFAFSIDWLLLEGFWFSRVKPRQEGSPHRVPPCFCQLVPLALGAQFPMLDVFRESS